MRGSRRRGGGPAQWSSGRPHRPDRTRARGRRQWPRRSKRWAGHLQARPAPRRCGWLFP